MNCPHHPHQKMTLLFNSYVCDICEPPKGVVIEARLVNVSVGFILPPAPSPGVSFYISTWHHLLDTMGILSQAQSQKMKIKSIHPFAFKSPFECCMQADVVLKIYGNWGSQTATIHKNRYGVQNVLKQIAIPAGVQSLIATSKYYTDVGNGQGFYLFLEVK